MTWVTVHSDLNQFQQFTKNKALFTGSFRVLVGVGVEPVVDALVGVDAPNAAKSGGNLKKNFILGSHLTTTK
jgi:hypothetical protein